MDRPCTLRMWRVELDRWYAFQATLSQLESMLLGRLACGSSV